MEFKEVIGTRRSVRYYKPWKPVEREKIQIMLEAANRSSRAVNADFVKAVVVQREELSQDVLESTRTATTTADLDQAPVHIYWYFDTQCIDGAQDRLKELVDLGILTAANGWSHAYVDEVVWPTVLQPIAQDMGVLLPMGAVECGLAICQAMLAAVDEGLGICLHGFNPGGVKEALDIPDHWVPLWVMLVGYSAEELAAGGQRPRRPLSRSYFEGAYGESYRWKEDPAVTDEMREAGLIQQPAPLPDRAGEVQALARMLGLPE